MASAGKRAAPVSVAVIVVAAGRGRRLGGETPKQYLPLADRAIIRCAAEAFLAVDSVDWLVPVIHPDDSALCAAALGDVGDGRLLPPVPGGGTRAGSVRAGLEALAARRPDKVLIHDAARPFVSRRIIDEVIAALDEAEGATAALPVVDAIWRADGTGRPEPVPRQALWRAQTPQGFRFDRILKAHEGHDGSAADDIAVAVDAGLTVRFVRGSERNYKITTAEDYARAAADAARGNAP